MWKQTEWWTMADCHLAGCGKCDCVGMRIPDEEGSTWAFDGVEDVRICRDSNGVVVHYREVGK